MVFFMKENNHILCNGIFGSKPNTCLMKEWKKRLINLLDIKKKYNKLGRGRK